MGVLWRENMAGQGGRGHARSETPGFLPREMEDIACLALSICRVLEVEDDEEGQVAMACAILNHMRRFGREGGGQGGSAGEQASQRGAPALAGFCHCLSGGVGRHGRPDRRRHAFSPAHGKSGMGAGGDAEGTDR